MLHTVVDLLLLQMSDVMVYRLSHLLSHRGDGLSSLARILQDKVHLIAPLLSILLLSMLTLSKTVIRLHLLNCPAQFLLHLATAT